MVTGAITEVTTRPAVPSAPIFAEECIVVVGQTSAADAPVVGRLTHITHDGAGVDGAEQFGAFSDGTLPQALKLIYDTVRNINVVAIRAGDQLVGALGADITDSEVDITLTAAATTTIEDGDVLLIETEQMKVTAVTSQTAFTVTRGVDGTAAAAHVATDDVSLYLSVINALDQVEDIEGDLRIRPTRITTGEMTWNVTAAGVIDNADANDLVAKMEAIANDLHILSFASAPDGDAGDTSAQALPKARAWAAVNPSSRVAGVYPHVYVPGQTTAIPAGPLAAALTAKRARDKGYWANPQGIDADAISRISKTVRFDMFDSTAASQLLTGDNLLTFVRFLTGWRLYGNRLMQESSSTDRKRFISRRQVFDQMRLFLQTAVYLAIEAQVGPAFFDSVTAYVNERIDALIARRAIDSGLCYPDRLLNTPDALEDGDTYWINEIDGVSDVVSVNFKLVEL